MKTKLMTIIGLLALACSGFAQTNITIPPDAPAPVQEAGSVLNFLSSAGTNLMVAGYGIYSTGSRSAGGGIALAYKLTDFIAPAVRLDYLNRSFYQGSFSTQLQYPLTFGNKITVVPFALGGVATPFGGAGKDNETVQGIAGVGLAVRMDWLGSFGKHLDLIADWEKWSATSGNQYRFGVLYKF